MSPKACAPQFELHYTPEPRSRMRLSGKPVPYCSTFKARQLQCAGPDGPNCLGVAEVGALEKWYAEPRNSRGDVLIPAAVPCGSEPFWPHWLTGEANGAPARLPLHGRDFVRYLAFPDDPGEGYNLIQFDFDKDPARMKPLSDLCNATDPNLSRFPDRGGKIIMYHG